MPLLQRFPGQGRADLPGLVSCIDNGTTMVNVFVGCLMSDLPSNPTIPV
jgi:hypothetical protein